MNVNETETNLHTLEEVIYEFPDDASPGVTEYGVNKELDYSNQNYLIEEN